MLLPIDTLTSPDNGIIYAEIIQRVTLASNNPFNASGRKRKPGWKVKTLTEPPQIVEYPRNYVISSVPPSVLLTELKWKPREMLGLFVAQGLQGEDGETYINYGQVSDIIAEDDGTYKYMVSFRPLGDGQRLLPLPFTETDIAENEVSLHQCAMGLGMGHIFPNPLEVAARFAEILSHFPLHSSLSSWIKTFSTVKIAPAGCMVLDKWLQPQILDIEAVLIQFTGLSELIQSNNEALPVPLGDRNLSVAFDAVTIDTSPRLGATYPGFTTPGRNSSAPGTVPAIPDMYSRNFIRQVARGSASNPVTAVSAPTTSIPSVPPTTVSQTAAMETNVPYTGYTAMYDPSTVKHQALANKMAYVPTNGQLHKHQVTFKEGVYGKSHTKVEAMRGIEIVYDVENQFARCQDDAQCRVTCIYNGDMHLVPLYAWRDANTGLEQYEENWTPIKWTKCPELIVDVIEDLDHFWRLFNQFELAAARYYIGDYCGVIAHVKRNLQAGLLQFGGKIQFDLLQQQNRVGFVQCAMRYVRAVISKFILEVLLPHSNVALIDWLSKEGVQGELFFSLVSTKWQTIQLRDMRSSPYGGRIGNGITGQDSPAPTGNKGGPTNPRNQSPNPMTAAMKRGIPTVNGVGVCVMSYTNRGCNRPTCTFHMRGPGSPALKPDMQAWLIACHGSYNPPPPRA